ncbi:hypothetical protein PR048_033026 [Dryococelus australis]|uniref:Uncharacterized protein n=1 Tax=Dryococelus australis TaxID=614101 RepID=A0ABQ9G6T7_9NEOP|nr:hypothetical protein PR048_033026 [Dryococelus australis]
MMSLYRIIANIRKWTVGMIMHFFDWWNTEDANLLLVLQKETFSTASGLQNRRLPFFELLPSASKRSRTRVPHPPDVLRKRHVLHLPEFPEKQMSPSRL